MAKNGSAEVNRIRRQISREEYEAYQKEDRVAQLTRHRDRAPVDSDLWKSLDSQIQTELLAREQAAFRADLTKQDTGTADLYNSIAAHEAGPLRSQRLKWRLGDALKSARRNVSWLWRPFVAFYKWWPGWMWAPSVAIALVALFCPGVTGPTNVLVGMISLSVMAVVSFMMVMSDFALPERKIGRSLSVLILVMLALLIPWKVWTTEPHGDWAWLIKDYGGRVIRVEHGKTFIDAPAVWRGETVWKHEITPIRQVYNYPMADGFTMSGTYTTFPKISFYWSGDVPNHAHQQDIAKLVEKTFNARIRNSTALSDAQIKALDAEIKGIENGAYKVVDFKIEIIGRRYQ